MTYSAQVYREQGGDKLVIDATGEIRVNAGGKITDDGVQASAISNVTGGATQDAEARTAINAILAALRGVGIIAT